MFTMAKRQVLPSALPLPSHSTAQQQQQDADLINQGIWIGGDITGARSDSEVSSVVVSGVPFGVHQQQFDFGSVDF